MPTAKIKCENPEEVVKEAFWLAWQACGGPSGFGAFRDNPGATKEAVWNNVMTAGDYPDHFRRREPGRAYGDYVFGRMMKLMIGWDDEGVLVDGDGSRLGYQSWSSVYPSYTQLVEAAIKNLVESAA